MKKERVRVTLKTKRERDWSFVNNTVGSTTNTDDKKETKADTLRDSCTAKPREKLKTFVEKEVQVLAVYN